MKIAILKARVVRAAAACTMFAVSGALICRTIPAAPGEQPPAAPLAPAPIRLGDQQSDKKVADKKPRGHDRVAGRPFEGFMFFEILAGAEREPVFIDLDTHRWMTPPPDLLAAENKGKPVDQWVFPKPLQQWIQRSGIDLAVQTDGRSLTVMGFDVRTGDSFPANDHKSEISIAESVAPAPPERSKWITLNLRIVRETIFRRTPFVTREGGLGTFRFHVSGQLGPNTIHLDSELARGPEVPKLTGQPVFNVYEPPILGPLGSNLLVDVDDHKLRLRVPGGSTQIELATDQVIVREVSHPELRAARLKAGSFEIDAAEGRVAVRARKAPTLRRLGDRVKIAYDKPRVHGRYERNPDERVAVTDQLVLSMPEGTVHQEDALDWETVKPSPEVLKKQADERRKRDEAGNALYSELATKHGYSLAPGQLIKHIPRPFAEARDEYWRVTRPDQFYYLAPDEGRGPGAELYRWDGKVLHEGPCAYPDHFLLLGLCQAVRGLKPQQISGPKNLLITPLPGDWIVPDRPLTDEVFVAQLEPILRNELKLPIHLEFRDQPREVYVARGTWHLTPLADTRVRTGGVQVYGKEMNFGRFSSGGGRGDFTKFLRGVGDWIDAPIISDVAEPPQQVSWRLHGPAFKLGRQTTDAEKREARDPALVLHNVEVQTGLKFSKERRSIRLLFVEEKPL